MKSKSQKYKLIRHRDRVPQTHEKLVGCVGLGDQFDLTHGNIDIRVAESTIIHFYAAVLDHFAASLRLRKWTTKLPVQMERPYAIERFGNLGSSCLRERYS